MEIAYYGMGCFRLKGKEHNVVLDVTDDLVRKQVTKSGTVFFVDTDGHCDPAALRNQEAGTQRVSGAGEFEIGGTEVKGIANGGTTAMLVTIDDVRCLTLGAADSIPDDAVIDAIGHVDVLFIPTGGHSVLDAPAAVSAIRAIEPAVVIPMHYRAESVPGSDGYDELDHFCKEFGLEDVNALAKVSISPSSSQEDDGSTAVILEPQR